MSSIKTAIMIGDVSGSAGLKAIAFALAGMRKEFNPSIVIANGENSASGYGISAQSAEQLFKFGVDVITSGNHAFECASDIAIFDQYDRLLRPENFHAGNAGHGFCIVDTPDKLRIAVLNLHVPSGVASCDNPYSIGMKAISRLQKETPIIFVDLHGEIAAQKEAFAFEADGKVTAVCGTHTHVQTMDEKVLPKSTAYITDLGMTGVQDSVIGGDVALSIRRMTSSLPVKVPPAQGEGEIRGCLISFDCQTGRAVSIRRISS